MEPDNFLLSYVPLVDYLGYVLGSHCEVVLHDVRNVENSIIAIKNGHISNRYVGGPLTDLALKILKDRSYVGMDYLINYAGRTKDGKLLRSSTFFIKDRVGNVVGMLCANFDISAMVETRNVLNEWIHGSYESAVNEVVAVSELQQKPSDPIEDMNTSIEDLTASIIGKTLLEADVPPQRMSSEERMTVVQKLSEKGVFLIKGAVAEVAKHLRTSEATIYRYLKQIES